MTNEQHGRTKKQQQQQQKKKHTVHKSMGSLLVASSTQAPFKQCHSK